MTRALFLIQRVTLLSSLLGMAASSPTSFGGGHLNKSLSLSPTDTTSPKAPLRKLIHQNDMHERLVGAIEIGVVDENDSMDGDEARPVVPRPSVAVRGGGDASSEVVKRTKIASYFALWYVLNVVYNIVNKKVLNVIPAPLTVGSVQFGIGALYTTILWMTRIRPTPKLTPQGKSICWRIGIYHAAGQLFSMVSLGAGPVSFTHIVKALEPFFSAIVSALIFGKWMKPQVYATLIPVVAGVGYACIKERSFSWLAFCTAMGSNVAFALRAVVSKSAMINYVGENINPVNLFGVITCASFLLSVPVFLMGEGFAILEMWNKAVVREGATLTASELAWAVVVSGLFHYLNNEVMYLALGNVHPVTLAVGNTMKRVIIMVASVIAFQNPISLQAGIGSAIGISGVLLYSLTKQHYEKLEAQAEVP